MRRCSEDDLSFPANHHRSEESGILAVSPFSPDGEETPQLRSVWDNLVVSQDGDFCPDPWSLADILNPVIAYHCMGTNLVPLGD
jgi:hypothetical protein